MRLVLFKDLLEEDATPEYGIVLDDNTILCLCCYGIIEEEDYEILEDNIECNISQFLKWDLEA
jgi:hypothetical protein